MTEFTHQINDLETLRGFLGEPGPIASNKQRASLDDHARAFIAAAPMLTLCTADASGRCDASPRGDAPGFVRALDDERLVIPERPGNRRADSLKNILENPQVGLLFVIPGSLETLRVNGQACLTREPEILELLAAEGKIPLLAIGVRVTEVFLHCGKAFKRSRLWEPESWTTHATLPSAGRVFVDHAGITTLTEEAANALLERDYREELY